MRMIEVQFEFGIERDGDATGAIHDGVFAKNKGFGITKARNREVCIHPNTATDYELMPTELAVLQIALLVEIIAHAFSSVDFVGKVRFGVFLHGGIAEHNGVERIVENSGFEL